MGTQITSLFTSTDCIFLSCYTNPYTDSNSSSNRHTYTHPSTNTNEQLKLGVYYGGNWYIDNNGDDFLSETDKTIYFGTTGDIPLIGDWNNDGTLNAGVSRP